MPTETDKRDSLSDLRRARARHQLGRLIAGLLGLVTGWVLVDLSTNGDRVEHKILEVVGGAVFVAAITTLGAWILHLVSRVEQREVDFLEQAFGLTPAQAPRS